MNQTNNNNNMRLDLISFWTIVSCISVIATASAASAPALPWDPTVGEQDCQDSGDVGNYFLNFCEEKCVCEEITPGNYDHVCYREREEFTCMSTERRERFLQTYKAVTTEGHPQYNQMLELIETHGGSNFFNIHTDEWFLPWHRWYSTAVENILRNEDCRVTLPWWRWSKKSTTWQTGTPFSEEDNWLGTDSDSFGDCVDDGAFAHPGWKPPGDVCLDRNFMAWDMPLQTEISDVLSTPASGDCSPYPNCYAEFSASLEHMIHDSPHVNIGGDMVTDMSPREPTFFLHHNYIDKLWDDWQQKSSTHLNAYHPDLDKRSYLPHVVGATPSKVKDNFKLEEMKIIYVDVQSSPMGKGHIAIL